jgi:hypothetical protein
MTHAAYFEIDVEHFEIEMRSVVARDRAIGDVQRKRGLALTGSSKRA